MRIWRRVGVLIGLLFWQGGFLFYAAVVVPVGRSVLRRQLEFMGRITSDVTNYLNLIGAFALLLLLWDALAAEPSAWRRIVRQLLWSSMVLCQALLVWLHLRLDEQFRGVLPSAEAASFHLTHRIYLWTSTVQWAAGMAFLVLSVRAWSAQDQQAQVVTSS
jgi:hypothetical protein